MTSEANVGFIYFFP